MQRNPYTAQEFVEYRGADTALALWQKFVNEASRERAGQRVVAVTWVDNETLGVVYEDSRHGYRDADKERTSPTVSAALRDEYY